MRGRILDAAALAFARHGYAGTGVEEVAGHLGVGKATVYRHFPCKKDLFLAAAARRMVQLGDAVEADMADATDPLERIRRGALSYLRFCAAHPEVVELLLQERAAFPGRRLPTYFLHREEKMRAWVGFFRDLMEAGVLRRGDPERTALILADSLYGTMIVNHFSGRRRSHERQARDLLDVAFRGILADTARGPAPRRKAAR